MIREELESIIAEEKNMYIKSKCSFQRFTHQKRYMIWEYLKYFRKTQFYRDQIKVTSGVNNILVRITYRLVARKKNILGEKCGVEIANNCTIGRRLDIWHGGVVINADLGDDCIIRGNNVLGNKGLIKYDGEPTIGNKVDIGVGAVIIGNVKIADGCEIGANAVVTKSFTEPGSVIVGIPGRILERR